MHVAEFLFVIASTLVAAKLLGELAERFGQPAVLGELVAGVLLGASVLGVVHPEVEIIHLLAEVGVIILLFEIGLETDLKKLMSVGPAAFAVALAGVALPFGLGYLVASLFGLDLLPSLVAGAALTATSVGITARVLSDLGRLNDPEGQIVLGAAVIDDVLGLVILSVVGGVVAGGTLSVGGVALTTAAAFGFLAAAIVLGRLVVPPLFAMLGRIGKEQTVAMMGLALAFLFAVIAERVGSAFIIGAFAAGLVIAPTPQHRAVEAGVVRLGYFFVPIFFVAVGAAVDVRSFATLDVTLFGIALTLVAVVGKIAAGYAPWWFKGRKLVIGVAMVPRGEVGLIFAQMGLTTGVLAAGDFSGVMFMVMATTFLAPIALKRLLTKDADGKDPGEYGIAELTTEA
ncbi:MAG: cation:proton antiporter [Longimicrobiales bacterium]